MCGTHECRKLNCNWSTPHTVTGFTISQYNINITMAEDVIVQGVLTDTQYTIDLSNRVSYTVTVVAVTGNAGDLIEGEVDRFQITLNTSKLLKSYNSIESNICEWMYIKGTTIATNVMVLLVIIAICILSFLYCPHKFNVQYS